MKIIGIILLAVGIIGIVMTVMLPSVFGYGGLIAGITAILTGVVFLASVRSSCERWHNNGCCG